MREAAPLYRDAGLGLALVTTDPAPVAAGYRDELGLDLPVLIDDARRTVAAYRLHNVEENIAVPCLFLIDTRGTVHERLLGHPAPVTVVSTIIEALERLNGDG